MPMCASSIKNEFRHSFKRLEVPTTNEAFQMCGRFGLDKIFIPLKLIALFILMLKIILC